MRKFLLLALPLVALTSGCQLSGGKTHSGCGFWWYTPPSIDTEMPVLVNAPQTQGTAHPVGSVAGPISDGTFNHAPIPPMGMAPMPKGAAIYSGGDGCYPPPGPPRLTIQEWRDCINGIRVQPSPGTTSGGVQ